MKYDLKICGDNFEDVLNSHELWVKTEGESGSRAVFDGANLQDRHFRYRMLNGARFCAANLSGADFTGCSLAHAVFTNADLSFAEFEHANLLYAELINANLNRAYNLDAAWIKDATLVGARNIPSLPMVCPEKGSFHAFKKCKTEHWERAIVELVIPARAKRSSATGNKCRASEAKVVDIYIPRGGGERFKIDSAHSWFDESFIYEVGKTVRPRKPFDNNRWFECESGIHFFMSRKEAEDYEI